MPRKKTMQSPPLKVIQTQDDLEIEIRDAYTRLVGRGQDKAFDAEELDTQVLNGIVDVLLTGSATNAKRLLGLLETPRTVSALAKEMQLWGYDQQDRALWNRAKAIGKLWRVYMNALDKADGPKAQSVKDRLDRIRNS